MATFSGQTANLDYGHASWGTLTAELPFMLGTDYGDTAARTFFRFVSVAIPPGSTINSASVAFTRGYADSGSLGVAFRAVAHDNAPAFTTAAAVTGAALAAPSTSLTSTSAAWNVAGTTTVDVTGQVAAVVGRAGWASGNALALLAVNAGSSGNGYFEVASAATLTVDYTPPVVETPPDTPTGLNVTPDVSSAVVGWTGSAGATSYDIEYEPVAVDAAGTLTLTGSGSLTFTGSPAQSGTLTLTGAGTVELAGTAAQSGTLTLTGAGELVLAGSRPLPEQVTPGVTTGHLVHHEILHAAYGGTLPATVTEGQAGHLAHHADLKAWYDAANGDPLPAVTDAATHAQAHQLLHAWRNGGAP